MHISKRVFGVSGKKWTDCCSNFYDRFIHGKTYCVLKNVSHTAFAGLQKIVHFHSITATSPMFLNL